MPYRSDSVILEDMLWVWKCGVDPSHHSLEIGVRQVAISMPLTHTPANHHHLDGLACSTQTEEYRTAFATRKYLQQLSGHTISAVCSPVNNFSIALCRLAVLPRLLRPCSSMLGERRMS